MPGSNYIFICYRRGDNSGHAGRLRDHLARHFSGGQIFMDIDMIEPGLDYAGVIKNAVGACDVQGASMPRRTDLTEPLAALADKQALNLNHEHSWDHEMSVLIRLLEGLGIAPVEEPPEEPEPLEEEPPEEELHIVASPIVGVFYRAPTPAADPFVRAGSRVETQTVVCVIEAMKLMNEVQAETTGTVKRFFVEDGDLVEYGQPLLEVTKDAW